MRYCILLLSFLIFNSQIQGQQLWSSAPNAGLIQKTLPEDSRVMQCNIIMLTQQLNLSKQNLSGILDLPMPDGSLATFKLTYSPVLGPHDAAQYPSIQTFSIEHIGNKKVTGRIGISLEGFYATYMVDGKTYMIRKIEKLEQPLYAIYNLDAKLIKSANDPSLFCGTDQQELVHTPELNKRSDVKHMHHYKLAISATSNFAKDLGFDTIKVLAKVVEAVNLLNAKYNIEFGIHFDMVDYGTRFFNFNPQTDYFKKRDQGLELLQQNQNFIDSLLTPDEYDISQLFTGNCIDVGGVVWGLACRNADKARGVSCRSNDDDYFFTTLKHEVGHQFTGGHTFNSCNGSSQYNPYSSFEPGAGSTILSYGNNCGTDNVGERSDFFHSINIQQIGNYNVSQEGECGTLDLNSTNHIPEVTIPIPNNVLTIPIKTPFELQGSATDADNKVLLYNWEQFDVGAGEPLGTNFASGPLFVVDQPSTTNYYRSFPRLDDVIRGRNTILERLPEVSREMNFNLTVRDANPIAGASVSEKLTFQVTEDSGPFQFSFPSKETDTVFSLGQYVTLTWDVANSDLSPVNATHVNILFSTNNAYTFPDTLVMNTPNDGIEEIMLPKYAGKARFKIKPTNNIFYNISHSALVIKKDTIEGFAFDLINHELSMCRNSLEAVIIRSLSLGGYEGKILYTAEAPLGSNIKLSFQNDSTNAGVQNKLIIDTKDAAAGEYTLIITGSSPSGIKIPRSIRLSIADQYVATPAPILPKDGDLVDRGVLKFNWEKVDGATYRIQISNSPSFSAGNVLIDTVININQFSNIEILKNETVYYWRVVAQSDCGFGRWSSLSFFKLSSLVTDINLQRIQEDTLKVKSGSFKHIISTNLTVATYTLGGDQLADSVYFQLVTIPLRGNLLLTGEQLNVGDFFSQNDIDNGKLIYTTKDSQYQGGDNFDLIALSQKGIVDGFYSLDIDIRDKYSLNTKSISPLGLHVYPNPGRDIIYIELPEFQKDLKAKLLLYNFQGQQLQELSTGDKRLFTMPLNTLLPGNYILRYISGNTIKVGTFTKI